MPDLQPVCKKTAHSEVSILLFFRIHLAVPQVLESHLLCMNPCLLPEGTQHRSSSESLYLEDLCNRSDMLQASRWELPADATFYSFPYLEIKDILETGRGINDTMPASPFITKNDKYLLFPLLFSFSTAGLLSSTYL